MAVSTLLLAGCGASRAESDGQLSLERLAFVPRGHAVLFLDLRCAAEADLLVDRFEVTRELWREVSRRAPQAVAGLEHLLGEPNPSAEEDWPACGMTYEEARAFAEQRGMRLLSAAEWLYVAVGSRAQYWPHGNSREASVANTAEVGLGRPVAVGAFPNGRTDDTGVHDMLGNAWEWTSPPLLRGVVPSTWFAAGESPWERWAFGGAFTSPAQPLWGFGPYSRRTVHARGIDPAPGRASDIGLRCCAEAEAFLVAHADEWSRDAFRDRVRAVGRRWGSRAIPLLERLASRPAAPRALDWLLKGARP